MLAVDRFAWFESRIRHHYGAVRKPGTPFLVDAYHEWRSVMPSGQLAEPLQADQLRSWVKDFIGVMRLALRKPLPDGLHGEIVDWIFRFDSRSADGFPQPSAGVADQDELAAGEDGMTAFL